MEANYTKQSFNNHEAKSNEACMKTNKMKKSRSIKKFDGGSRHELDHQPGKPPPCHSTTKIRTCSRKMSSPNYMKSTRSSQAKEGRVEVSASSSVKLQWMVKSLTRSSSLRNMRTKIQRRKWSKGISCENLDGKKGTCSSKQKDSKFPARLRLNPGGTEAQGTSASKVCHYNHCSLNGLHHKPALPLKRFLASRRQVVETKKIVRTKVIYPREEKGSLMNEGKDEFFVEIYVPEREARWPKQEENSTCVDVEEIFGERMGLELEEGQIFDVHCDNEDKSSSNGDIEADLYISGSKTNASVNDDLEDSHAEIAEWRHFCDASSAADSEFTQPGDEYNEELIREDYTNSPHRLKDGGTICYQNLQLESINHGDCVLNAMDEVTEAGRENLDSHQDLGKSHDEFEHTGAGTREKDYTGTVMYQRLSSDNVELASSSKEASRDLDNNQPEFDKRESGNEYDADGRRFDISTESQPADDGNSLEKRAANNRFDTNKSISRTTRHSEEQDHSHTVKLRRNEDCVVLVKEPDAEESNTTTDLYSFPDIAIKTSMDSGNKVRSWTRCKKEENKSEQNVREFNPRGPNFLPIKPDPEPEKVDLRHQEMDGRRNAEEWMTDYALQKTVNQLASARKKKVALLVEAFESVRPVSELQPHQKRDSSNYSRARARPVIQIS